MNIKTVIFCASSALLALATLGFTTPSRPLISDAAMRLHRDALVIDGHNDLPWRLREESDLTLEKHDLKQDQSGVFMTDIPRLRQGGVGAQFWSAYVPVELMDDGTAVKTTFEQVDLIHRMVQKYPDTFELAYTAADITRIRQSGKIASLIGIEGGHSIDDSLDTLRKLFAQGARYMTLTHFRTLDWADSANDVETHHGLTSFGEDVVREMNKLGMLVDISHISADTMRHVLRVAKAPMIASHSSAFSVTHNPRNVPDDVLKSVAANGGVVMVNFYPPYIIPDSALASSSAWIPGFHLAPNARFDCETSADVAKWRKENRMPRADVHMIADHIDHIVQVAGIDHVGLGSDFDGVPEVPEDVKDVGQFPLITQELLNRHYSEDEIRKILGGNLLRAFAKAEDVARHWK